MAKKDLAARLGVTPRTVSNYEADCAPGKYADVLSAELGFPPGFFLRPPLDGFSLEDVAFRADSGIPARSRNVAMAMGTLGRIVYTTVSSLFSLPGKDLPDLSEETPRDAAWLLRRHWGLGDRPLPDIVQLAESRGIRVCGIPSSLRGIDGYSQYLEDDTAYIFISRGRTPERFRFSLAHEIGHLVLHGGIATGKEEEREANEFASEFLIPRGALLVRATRPVSANQVLALRSYFGASAMAIAGAAKRAGLLSEYAYRHVCATLSRQGYRTSEPGGMTRYDQSRVFTLIKQKDPETFRSANLAQRLDFPVEDVRTLTMEPPLAVVNGSSRTPREAPREQRPNLRIV